MLESKIIVVTGGSLGIGLSISKKCAENGATVVMAARNKNDLENALKEIKAISANPHSIYSIDVSEKNEIDQFSRWTKENFGTIDGLVNCAGIYGPIGKTTNIDLNIFKKTIEINFLGTVFMCNAFAPLLKSSTRKKIVNFSGGGAATPFPNYSAYASSKAALVRFTENLSLELSDDYFDVNCIAPGFVVTRLHQQTLEVGTESAGNSFYEATKKQIETGGVSPEKAADLTVFLLSSKSDGITGKFISASWDSWEDESFIKLLKIDKDFCTLRRVDNKTFYKKI